MIRTTQSALVQRTALAKGIATKDSKSILHGDNGATLKATTVLAMQHWLGVKASDSRPPVSDDNAFVEALFRTANDRPEYPKSGFADLRTRGSGLRDSCIGTSCCTATAAFGN